MQKEVETSVFSRLPDIVFCEVVLRLTNRKPCNQPQEAIPDKKKFRNTFQISPTVTLTQATVSQRQTAVFTVLPEDTGVDAPPQPKSSLSTLRSLSPWPSLTRCSWVLAAG